MADKINLLTVKKVDKLLRRGEPGRHFDGKGLYLIIENKANANWGRRYELHHKAHQLGLGSAFVFTLAEARERNRKISQQLADGIDPLAEKRAQRAAQAATVAASKTFKQCAEDFIAAHQAKWRSARHGQQWQVTLEQYVYPRIGGIDVRAIGRPHIFDVLEQKVPATKRNPAGQFWLVRAVTANRVRSRIELILSYAAGRGYRGIDNPARWDDLQHVLPAPTKVAKVEHHAAVPYAELPALMAKLRAREGVAAHALQFLILTAARAGEVLGAVWSEIDLGEKLWTIPAERMKSGKEHRVPLCDAAVALLKSLYTEDGNKFLFIGPRQQALSHAALTAVLRRLDRDETVHGFRSSFSDWAHEQTAHSNHAIELSLAHSIGTEAEKAYRRGEMMAKRRKLMDAWSRYCTTPPTGSATRKAATDNVVTIGSAR